MISSRKLLGLILALTLVIPTVFASSGDLVLTSDNVKFASETFLEGQSIRIWASVKNSSGNDLLGSVRYSSQNGQIGSDQPISALAGRTDDVFVDFTPQTYGEFTITVKVIPWDASQDNPDNNTVQKTVTVYRDTDRDGIPNSSDPDMDNDDALNEDDDFPLNPLETTDTDGDGIGDNADTDDDNDGTLDTEDDFPFDSSFSSDTDGDGIPNESDTDIDGDGISNDDEISIGTNPSDEDSDEDGTWDGEDPFPTDKNEWNDMDGDGIGDNSDVDIDGDGVLNSGDSSPLDASPIAKAEKTVYITSRNKDTIFDASPSLDPKGAITSYIWTFEDGTLEGSKVKKRFDTRGLQAATLTVLDEAGQSDSVNVNIRVIDVRFLILASIFTLLLVLLAFYMIYLYNRQARKDESTSKKKK